MLFNTLEKQNARRRLTATILIDSIGLLTILALFYFLSIGHYPLFNPDEGRYSEVAREMILRADYITPRLNGIVFLDKPILFYWLQVIAIKCFGLTEWSLRFFPALLGILGCFMVYWHGRLLFDRRTGLIAAAILATTPFFFGGAHYANMDLEVAVEISASLLFLMSAYHHQSIPTARYFYAAYGFAALAFLTKGLIGIVFPILIIGSLIIFLRRYDLLKKSYLPSGFLLFAIIVLPWYFLMEKANPGFFQFFFIKQQFQRFLSSATFNNATPFWFYLPMTLVGFTPWTLFLPGAFRKSLKAVWQNRFDHPVELFLLLWIGIVLIFFSVPRSKTIGYILPVFPALALLVANYLNALFKTRIPPLKTIISLLLLNGSFAFLLLSSHSFFQISPMLIPYVNMTLGVYALNSVLALYDLQNKNVLFLFLNCLFTSALFLIILSLSANYLNRNTTKHLVASIKPLLRPQDEIITYFKYYQDLPLYLKRRITIVADWTSPDIPNNDNWLRELWYGRGFQNTGDWLIDESTFWKRWNSDKRIFLFLNKNYLYPFGMNAYKETVIKRPHFIAQDNDILVLSNSLTKTLTKNP